MNDRERDAKIAEGLMGWSRVHVEAEAWADVHNQWHADYCGTLEGTRTVVPHYSTDPGDSKKLREKLAETWEIWELFRAKDPAPFKEFSFEVSNGKHPDYGEEKYSADADAEEAAVAACAIKLLDVKEGQ